jgi:hypothetical protein
MPQNIIAVICRLIVECYRPLATWKKELRLAAPR